LADRDGIIDVEKRTLSRREEGMTRYAKPLSRIRDVDRSIFEAQYASFDPKLPTPAEAMLLVALVKVNAAEAYGVNTNYERAARRFSRLEETLELTLLVEESYHTRILLSTAVLYRH
jgi:hypothetical protein